eukprot:g32752.t1
MLFSTNVQILPVLPPLVWVVGPPATRPGASAVLQVKDSLLEIFGFTGFMGLVSGEHLLAPWAENRPIHLEATKTGKLGRMLEAYRALIEATLPPSSLVVALNPFLLEAYRALIEATLPPSSLVVALSPFLADTFEPFFIRVFIGIVWYFVLGGALWMLIAALLPKTVHNHVSFAWVIWWFPYMVLLLPTGVLAVWTLCGNIHDRWYGNNLWSEVFMVLYVSNQSLGLVHEVLFEEGASCSFKKWLMYVHHMISAGCFFAGLFMGRMQFWACYAGLCEITNIPLNILTIAKWKGFREVFEQSLVLTRLVQVNGILLWLGFLVLRVLLFPTFIFYFTRDCLSPPSREDPCATVTWGEKFMYPFITILIWSLSFYWFILIHKGMLKAVGLRPADPKKEKSN